MFFRAEFASLTLLATFFQLSSALSSAQSITRLCNPALTPPIVVASPAQRLAAGAKAQPPLTDTFDWPDTPLGVIKTGNGYEFFGSDGGAHYRQMWQGHWVGNNKSGSFTSMAGTLDNPLGTGNPQDVSVSPNPNPSVNPIYPSYGYLGGGPVFQVPAGMTGAGNLLATYQCFRRAGAGHRRTRDRLRIVPQARHRLSRSFIKAAGSCSPPSAVPPPT